MTQKRINFLNRDEFLEHLNELANSVTDTQQKIEIMKMIKDLATCKEEDKVQTLEEKYKDRPLLYVAEQLNNMRNILQKVYAHYASEGLMP